MFSIIKRAVNRVIPRDDAGLNKAIACTMIAMSQEEIPVVHNNTESFDLVVIAGILRNKFITLDGCPTPLEYAHIYQSLGGNALVFLNIYQNYFGPIE